MENWRKYLVEEEGEEATPAEEAVADTAQAQKCANINTGDPKVGSGDLLNCMARKLGNNKTLGKVVMATLKKLENIYGKDDPATAEREAAGDAWDVVKFYDGGNGEEIVGSLNKLVAATIAAAEDIEMSDLLKAISALYKGAGRIRQWDCGWSRQTGEKCSNTKVEDSACYASGGGYVDTGAWPGPGKERDWGPWKCTELYNRLASPEDYIDKAARWWRKKVAADFTHTKSGYKRRTQNDWAVREGHPELIGLEPILGATDDRN